MTRQNLLFYNNFTIMSHVIANNPIEILQISTVESRARCDAKHWNFHTLANGAKGKKLRQQRRRYVSRGVFR